MDLHLTNLWTRLAELAKLGISAATGGSDSNDKMLIAQTDESNSTGSSLQALTHGWSSAEHKNDPPYLLYVPPGSNPPTTLPAGYTGYTSYNPQNNPENYQAQGMSAFYAIDPNTQQPITVNGYNVLMNPYNALQVILQDESTNSPNTKGDMATFVAIYMAPSGGTGKPTAFSMNLAAQSLAAMTEAWDSSSSASASPAIMNSIQSFSSVVAADGSDEETPLQTMLRNLVSQIQQNPSALSTIAQIGSAINQMNRQLQTLISA